MNRRGFLTIGTDRLPNNRKGSGTPSIGVGKQNQPVFARRTSAGLEPYTGAWDYARAAHLLRRCMVGPADPEIRKAVADGMNAAVTGILTPFTVNTDMISGWAGQDPQVRVISSTPGQPPTQADIDAYTQILFSHQEQITRWSVQAVATSPVSVQERMTWFWMNHFVVELEVVKLAEWVLTWNQLLRQNCLGNLKTIVSKITTDRAMLNYLNGDQNYKIGTRDNINENYGRELMELFTTGILDWSGAENYSQTDVHEAGRSLSGWTGNTSPKGTNYAGLDSIFVQARWDSGSKTFMGKTGAWKAQDIVDILFSERADQIAKFICGKIYAAFVYAVPDQTIVEAMAQTLRNGNWEIKPVMDQLLRSAHFYDTTNIGAMDKSPADYLVGAVRGLSLKNIPDFEPGTSGRTTQELSGRLNTLGQRPLDPPNVKGWEGGRNWMSTSTVPPRQKFILDVMDAKIRGRYNNQQQTIYVFDAVAFAKALPDYDDIHKLSTNMGLYLLNTPPSAKEAQMLYDTLLDGGKDYEWNIDDPAQRAAERIKKFIKAAAQLAKYQLY